MKHEKFHSAGLCHICRSGCVDGQWNGSIGYGHLSLVIWSLLVYFWSAKHTPPTLNQFEQSVGLRYFLLPSLFHFSTVHYTHPRHFQTPPNSRAKLIIRSQVETLASSCHGTASSRETAKEMRYNGPKQANDNPLMAQHHIDAQHLPDVSNRSSRGSKSHHPPLLAHVNSPPPEREVPYVYDIQPPTSDSTP